MDKKLILAGLLSAVCLNYAEHGMLNCTAAAEALWQHGVRPMVHCSKCKFFKPLQKFGWCDLYCGPRAVDDYCSRGEEKKKNARS